MKRIILASKSPRRSDLLLSLGLDFDVIITDANETLPDGISPDKAVMLLSARKADAIARENPDAVVIGADTVVYLPDENIILGKPKNRADAIRMLGSMSGRSHIVYTGVTVISDGESRTDCEATKVFFRALSDEEIEDYVDTNEYCDKAGGYGIQSLGGILVSHIEGEYFNVTGMPKTLTARLLSESGINILKLNKSK